MRVAILETFDVANGARFVKVIFNLRQSNLDCSKTVGGRDLSRGPHCKEAAHGGDECYHNGRFQQALDERDQKFILETLQDINPADISALLYEFNSEESKYALNLLPIEIQAEIINDRPNEAIAVNRIRITLHSRC